MYKPQHLVKRQRQTSLRTRIFLFVTALGLFVGSVGVSVAAPPEQAKAWGTEARPPAHAVANGVCQNKPVEKNLTRCPEATTTTVAETTTTAEATTTTAEETTTTVAETTTTVAETTTTVAETTTTVAETTTTAPPA